MWLAKIVNRLFPPPPVETHPDLLREERRQRIATMTALVQSPRARRIFKLIERDYELSMLKHRIAALTGANEEDMKAVWDKIISLTDPNFQTLEWLHGKVVHENMGLEQLRDWSRIEEIENLHCCGNCRYFNSDLLTENCDENDGDFREENRCEKWK